MSRRAPPDIARLLFVRTDRLGETLLNLPVLHAIRHTWPDAHLTFFVQEPLCELLAADGASDEVLAEPPLPNAWWRRAVSLARLWRQLRVDTVIISNPKKEYHAAAWLARIPRRIGYDRKGGWLLTTRVPDEKARGDRHEVDYNLDLVRAMGARIPEEPAWGLNIEPAWRERIEQRLASYGVERGERIIAIHPWTSNPKKQWPLERVQALAAVCVARRFGRVVIVGIPTPSATPPSGHSLGRGPRWLCLLARLGGMFAPRGASERVPGACPWGSTGGMADGPWPAEAINLAGQTSLRELAALLERSTVLISNDSGPVHLASAVGTPVVALFGTSDAGSHPTRWGPWGDGHVVLYGPLERLSVEQVVEAVQRVTAATASVHG